MGTASPDRTHRFSFTVATPVGETRHTYEVFADRLEFESSGLWNAGRVSVSWASVREAGTAVLGLPVGPGAPDLGRYVPRTLQWLVASRVDGAASFMAPLPPADDREALLTIVRERLGAKWVGDTLPFEAAQTRFALPGGGGAGSHWQAAAAVAGVLVLLAVFVVVAIVALSILIYPAALALAAWLIRVGLRGLRDANTIAAMPTSRADRNAIGLVALEGITRSDRTSPSGVSERPSVWWDVAVEARSADSRNDSRWHQLAARHGGTKGLFYLKNESGRVPVWVNGALLLLTEHVWESDRDELPGAGLALLDELGFPWQSRRMRVRETHLEVGAPVYVLGTLDQRRTIPAPGADGVPAGAMRQLRSGEWRATLAGALPPWLGKPVAILFMFLSIVLGVGRGGERPREESESPPPDLPPHDLIVWKGTRGGPFVVSDHRDVDALMRLRTRSLYQLGAGIAIAAYVIYELRSIV